ncbi:T9SS C-terminal target domain-containing protein [Ornithobacterium rhinotracheale]|uniref:endonuclease n=1 Tax=Ornithobacterium rhinotracheale TaxID=28251 RepID=UPI00129CC551|nr:endonuclease [Ornithobacterium rhinotracheale]MRJ10027.1 T9SS C-terminal target domain-containing protein [Ornithobacterium rhinotracheale]
MKTMKYRNFLLLFFVSICTWAQVPDYYKSLDLTKTGEAFKKELSQLIIKTHRNTLSYKQVTDVLKESDRDPQNSKNVLLIYGSENNDGKYARSRNKNYAGGAKGQWNKEHVYAKSLGRPNLGTSGPGADAHHLRPADPPLNSDRGSLPFDDGRGTKAYKTNRGGWFPGDEWKGDVARMMMYMALRYGDRCDPKRVGMNPYTISKDFPDIFLKWNIEDPVSDFEKQRNEVVAKAQGNRNPFIDNPNLATRIWGGTPAPDTWGKGTQPAPAPPTDPENPPVAPGNFSIKNLRASNVNPTNFTLTWNLPENFKSVGYYEVYMGDAFKQKTFTNTALINKLQPETSYTFKVVAKKPNGEQIEESQPFNFTTPAGVTDITNKPKTNKNIVFYPNPVTDGKLNVDGKNLQNVKWLKIYDLQGRLQKNIVNPFIHEGGFTIDVSNLTKGIYILKTPNHYEKILIL